MHDKIAEWLAYPSTWVSIVGLLTFVGVHISPEQTNLIAQAGVALSLAIFAFFSDSDVKK